MTVETSGAVTIPSIAATGGTINGTPIGGTTPSTGTFTTLIGGGSSANYGQLTGGATTKAVEFQTLGSDSNIALVLDSKGTGAIDLAAGSSGVNISNGGTVTAITRTAGGTGYTVAPTVTISAPTTAGGVQATATCTVTAGVVDTAFTITNAGSGYVEQPTITFTPVSGGSGATAYATVGSIPTIRTLASAISFATPSSEVFRIVDANPTAQNYVSLESSGSGVAFRAAGASATGTIAFVTKSTGTINFCTNTSSANVQMSVSNTASAVNYVQVTGAATGGTPAISAQGSDSAASLNFISKSTGVIRFYTATGSSEQFRVTHTAGTIVNYATATGNTTGASPSFAVAGTDADIDIAFTPKGAGAVRFGTYTASVLTPTGYITIKDSGGTSRRLLVG
jgi:hypothetical protein